MITLLAIYVIYLIADLKQRLKRTLSTLYCINLNIKNKISCLNVFTPLFSLFVVIFYNYLAKLFRIG